MTVIRSVASRASLRVDRPYSSVSEPFGWLYGSASLAAMSNLNDGSWQLTPEVGYTGFDQVELRARIVVLGGRAQSEFGEKLASRRLELTARLFF